MPATDIFNAIAMPHILTTEGRFSADPEDRGNWTGGARGVGELRGTKYGVAAASYPQLDIEKLSIDDARAIYRRDYWDKMRCDQLPVAVALAVFDTAVNQGPGRAAKWLQQAVHAGVDGVIGPDTIDRANSTAMEVVLPDLLSFRAAHYAMQNDQHHIRGWMARLFRLQLHCIRVAGLEKR